MAVKRDFRSARLLTETGLRTQINVDTVFDGNTLFIDASTDRVGIGTTSPEQPLHVEGVGSTTGSSDPSILLSSTGTGASDDTIFRMSIGGTSASNFIYFGDSGDTNIGMIRYSHGSDFMSFTTNASEAMRITSSGDVGIGTSSPSSISGYRVLSINDGGSGVVFEMDEPGGAITRLLSDANGFAITSDGTGVGGNPIRLKAGQISSATDSHVTLETTGELHMNNAAGPALLNEAASSTNPTLVPNRADPDTGIGWVSADIGSAVAGGAEAFRWDSSGNIQLQGSVQMDDNNVLMARDGTSFRMVTNASLPIELRAVDAQPIIFKTTNTERMRIDSSGNVGIGTSSPAVELEIASGQPELRLTDTDGTDQESTFIQAGGTLYLNLQNDTNNGAFRVRGYASGSPTDHFLVNGSGNVGIGTTSPAQALDVSGNIAVSGTVDGRDVATDGTKLDGIESGATADQTASEILTAIKTVDGAGSGLDADLLDGISSASFLRSDTSDSITSGSLTLDAGNITVNNGTNLQVLLNAADGAIEITRAAGGAYIDFKNTTAEDYDARLQESGGNINLNGNRILTTADEGSGNGLDADTVDGIEGASFLRSDADDTATGDITIGKSTSPTFTVKTTNGSSYNALIKIGGARTASSSHDISKLSFTNETSSAYTLGEISAMDPSANHSSGNGKLVFRTSSGGTLSDKLVIPHTGNPTYEGSTVWHGGNDGSGSGLDADLLDGQQGSYYLNTSTSFGGDVSGTYNAIVIANDSHTHAFNNLTSKTSGTGEYSTNSAITSGRGSGGVSLTINDGYGNANVTWNHKSGTPEQNGNAGRIYVNTDATTNAVMVFQVKSGVSSGVATSLTQTLSMSETAATFSGEVVSSSDGRLKSNIEPIQNALQKINSISGYTFNKNGSEERQTGVIAQEIQKVLPEAVKEGDDGYLSVAYGNMAGIFVEAIKEQQKEIEELKSLIQQLINRH